MRNSHLVSQCLDVLDPVPWGILQENRRLISLHSFLWRHSHQDHIHKLAIGGRLCWGGRQEADSGAGTTWLPTLFHNSHLQLIFLNLSIVSRWEMWYPIHWVMSYLSELPKPIFCMITPMSLLCSLRSKQKKIHRTYTSLLTKNQKGSLWNWIKNLWYQWSLILTSILSWM